MSITPYTNSFIPLCTGTNVAIAGVTNAASAYDWFSLISGGSGALLSTYNGMSTSTAAGIQNKAFIAAIAQEARTALLPLVRAENFYLKASVIQTLISNNLNSILNTLTSIQNSALASSIGTLTPGYTASLSTINTMINTLKSQEAAVYAVGGSIDISSAAVITAFSATTVLSSFTGVKTYLSTMFDPATIGNGGTTIPAITSVNNVKGNVDDLATIFSAASSTLNNLTMVANLQALVEMSAQAVFDLYCGEIQGYASAGTTGNWASGSAPVGIIPGIDYELHLTGSAQTGIASAGTPGAPSVNNYYL